MEQEHSSGWGHYRLILGVLLTSVTAFCAQYCIQPVIKEVAMDFGRGADGAGIIMSASLLGMATMLLILVWLSGRLPLRRTLLGALCFAVLTTFAACYLRDFQLFVAVRFLQGAVLAMVPVLSITYARTHAAPEQAGFAVSMYICGVSVGGLIGRLALGMLTDFMPWRTALELVGCVLVALTAAEFFLLLPDKPKEPQPAGTGRALPLDKAELLPLLAVCLFGFAFSDCFFIVFNFIPYVFSAPPYNFNHTLISMLFLIQIFGSLSSFVAGKMYARFGAFRISCCSLLTIGAGALLTLPDSIWAKAGGLIILVMGFFGNQAMGGIMSSGISEANKASCTAAYMFTYYMGAAVVTAIGGYLYRAFGWTALITTEIVEVTTALACLFWFRKIMQRRGRTL